MNERIRELADKIWAEEYWDNPNTDKLLSAQLNKFAELIVWECIDVVVDVLPDIVPESKDGIHPAWHLKEHFGVE